MSGSIVLGWFILQEMTVCFLHSSCNTIHTTQTAQRQASFTLHSSQSHRTSHHSLITHHNHQRHHQGRKLPSTARTQHCKRDKQNYTEDKEHTNKLQQHKTANTTVSCKTSDTRLHQHNTEDTQHTSQLYNNTTLQTRRIRLQRLIPPKTSNTRLHQHKTNDSLTSSTTTQRCNQHSYGYNNSIL